MINAAAGHKMLSFMDGNAGYNQIFMALEDISKTTFRVPGTVGLFEYLVMTFGLKNAGATYQHAMNYIFHDLVTSRSTDSIEEFENLSDKTEELCYSSFSRIYVTPIWSYQQ